MFEVRGKSAIVTGSARGIGLACAEELLKQGARVCLSDIDTKEGAKALEKLQKVYEDRDVIFVPCDVSNPVEFEQLWSKAESELGKISILINNAGFYSDDVKKCLDVMLYGVSLGVNLALDKMNINNNGIGGRILNMSSIRGLVPMEGGKEVFGYVMAKSGVVGLTRAFAGETPGFYEQAGIKCYALCPHGVNTGLLGDLPDSARTKKSDFKRMETTDISSAMMQVFTIDTNGSVWCILPDQPIKEIPKLDITF